MTVVSAQSVSLPSTTRWGYPANRDFGSIGLPTIVGGSTALNDSSDSSYVDFSPNSNSPAFGGVDPASYAELICVEVYFGSLDLNFQHLELHLQAHGQPNPFGNPNEYAEAKVTTRICDANGNFLYEPFTSGSNSWPKPMTAFGPQAPWDVEIELYGPTGYEDNFAVHYDVNRLTTDFDFVQNPSTSGRINPFFDPSTGVYVYIGFAGSTGFAGTAWKEFNSRINYAYLRLGSLDNDAPTSIFCGVSTFYKTIHMLDSSGKILQTTSSRGWDDLTNVFGITEANRLLNVNFDGYQRFSGDLLSSSYLALSQQLYVPSTGISISDALLSSDGEPPFNNRLSVLSNYEDGTLLISDARYTNYPSGIVNRITEVDPETAEIVGAYDFSAAQVAPGTTWGFISPTQGGVTDRRVWAISAGTLNTLDTEFDTNSFGAWMWDLDTLRAYAIRFNGYLTGDYPNFSTTVDTPEGPLTVFTPRALYPTTDGTLWTTALATGPDFSNRHLTLIQWSIDSISDFYVDCTFQKAAILNSPVDLPFWITDVTGSMLVQGPDNLLYFWAACGQGLSQHFITTYVEGVFRVDPANLVHGLNDVDSIFYASYEAEQSGNPSWISFPLSGRQTIKASLQKTRASFV